MSKYSSLFEKRWIIYTDYIDLLLQRWIEICSIESLVNIIENVEIKMKNIDPKDSWYIALAEKLQIPIWTNDKKIIDMVNWITVVDTQYMIKQFL